MASTTELQPIDNLHARLLAAIKGAELIQRDVNLPADLRERAEQIRRVLLTARWAAFQLKSIPLPPVEETEGSTAE